MNYIQYHVADRIGFITLNRPEKRNALNYEVVSELKEAFDKAENDKDVKLIILRARGEAFVPVLTWSICNSYKNLHMRRMWQILII